MINANRDVTICSTAREDEFLLGNLYEKKLSSIWINPLEHIKEMRKEKHLDRDIL